MEMDLTLLHNISYGMYVVGARDGDHFGGCVINTCMQITSENPIFAISMNRQNHTYTLLEREKRFSLAVLSETTAPEVISAFGFFSGREQDKFRKFRYAVREGVPVLEENICVTLVLDVLQVVEMETHAAIFARLAGLIRGNGKTPMTYSYYHRVIKGKAPKNAPTYLAEEARQSSVRYVCEVCGYVYEGDSLPEDYVCPVCGVDASHFRKEGGAEPASGPVQYVCEVCGYVYEGDSLPADYVCPVCGVDASHFQKK